MFPVFSPFGAVPSASRVPLGAMTVADRELPPGWSASHDVHSPYYHHGHKGSVRKRPGGVLPCGWQEWVSKKHRALFCYNPASKKSQWVKPQVESGDVLNPTFGYAGSLDENPPFAKFDIRAHICIGWWIQARPVAS